VTAGGAGADNARARSDGDLSLNGSHSEHLELRGIAPDGNRTILPG
jgi:hypothetical protein